MMGANINVLRRVPEICETEQALGVQRFKLRWLWFVERIMILGICWLQQTSKDVIFRPILETAMEIMLKLLICFIYLVEKSL